MPLFLAAAVRTRSICSRTSLNAAGRQRRHLATSSTQTPPSPPPPCLYPFPSHRNPTPHQIFHLPNSATPSEIKARYYELVKEHHPDAANTHSLPSELANDRFNSIKRAYDSLRGIRSEWGSSSRSSSSSSTVRTRRPTGNRNARGELEYDYDYAFAGEGPRPHPSGATEPFFMSKEGVMMSLVGIVTFVILALRVAYISPTQVAAQSHLEAVQNLESARAAGKAHGEQRRQELKRWIEEGGLQHVDGGKIGHGAGRGVKLTPASTTADTKPSEPADLDADTDSE